MEKRKTVLLRITGRVQGVGYRAWAKGEADAFGVAGWVRNEEDGSVTALVAGPEDVVAAVIDRLRKGPRLAAVSGIAVEDASSGQVADGFRIAG